MNLMIHVQGCVESENLIYFHITRDGGMESLMTRGELRALAQALSQEVDLLAAVAPSCDVSLDVRDRGRIIVRGPSRKNAEV